MFKPKILTQLDGPEPKCPFCSARAKPLTLCIEPGVYWEWMASHLSSGETYRHNGRIVGVRAMQCENGHEWCDTTTDSNPKAIGNDAGT